MISYKAEISRLFRPWDSKDGIRNTTHEKHNLKQDKVIEHKTDIKKKTPLERSEKVVKQTKRTERDGRLRKIRNVPRKRKTQDDTISTTTRDEIGASASEGNIVDDLTKFCDRLLPASAEDGHPVGNRTVSENEKSVNVKNFETIEYTRKKINDKYLLDASFNMIPVTDSTLSHQNAYYLPGYLMNQHPSPANDLLMSLGDQMSMESFAQSYAFEMEYSRIMCEETRLKMMNAKKQRPKKFKCPVCDVGFSNNGQLKGHIRIHNGERPFKCDEADCGKAFTRNEELTRHKRIHSGIKPYPCPTCGKKFGRRDHLKKHTRTHFVTVEKMMPMFVPYMPPYHWGIY